MQEPKMVGTFYQIEFCEGEKKESTQLESAGVSCGFFGLCDLFVCSEIVFEGTVPRYCERVEKARMCQRVTRSKPKRKV